MLFVLKKKKKKKISLNKHPSVDLLWEAHQTSYIKSLRYFNDVGAENCVLSFEFFQSIFVLKLDVTLSYYEPWEGYV
jgi:hypothetical protein